MNIAVFASGVGTNLQAVMDACAAGVLEARVCAVISNKQAAGALERARAAGISAYYVPMTGQVDDEAASLKHLEILESHKADIILLAGYLRKIGTPVFTKYQDRVFNTHPALLPKHGGKGMYGINVHMAVLESGDKETGVTIHRINENYDEGAILAQTTVPVLVTDTPESLMARVQKREHVFLVETLKEIIKGLDAHDCEVTP